MIGLIIQNVNTGKYLAWVEMQPTWVDDIGQAYIQRDAYQLLVDFVILKDHGISVKDILIFYVENIETTYNIIKVIDLANNKII